MVIFFQHNAGGAQGSRLLQQMSQTRGCGRIREPSRRIPGIGEFRQNSVHYASQRSHHKRIRRRIYGDMTRTSIEELAGRGHGVIKRVVPVLSSCLL